MAAFGSQAARKKADFREMDYTPFGWLLSRRSALPGVRVTAKQAPKPRRRDRLETYATLSSGNAGIGRQQSTLGILPVAGGVSSYRPEPKISKSKILYANPTAGDLCISVW